MAVIKKLSTANESNKKKSARRIHGGDMLTLKNKLNISTPALQWLIGSSTRNFSTVGEAREEPIKQAARSLIARTLLREEDVSPIPKAPNLRALKEKMEQFSGKRIPDSKFGVYFGVNAGTGHQWLSFRTTPSEYIRNLMIILDNLLDRYGETGWRTYIKILEEEAIARGIEGGFEEVLKAGGWVKAERRKDRKAKHPNSRDTGTKTAPIPAS